MSSYNHMDPEIARRGVASDSDRSEAVKVYRFVMFCVPIFFTFMVLFLFYLFYLRPRRVNWSSLRMRTTSSSTSATSDARLAFSMEVVESGLRKEVREMLPIIVYRESFSVRDTQCSVCLGDYEAEDRLQQIPTCRHTFHMDCIDSWLATHTTCPLCRLSLLPSAKELPDVQEPNARPDSSFHQTSQPTLQPVELRAGDTSSDEENSARSHFSDHETEQLEHKGHNHPRMMLG